MLLLTQDALEDWSRRYPRDPWIVRDEHKLAPLFGDLETDEGNAGMHRCNGVLVRVGASPVLARTRAPHVRHVANAKRKPKRLFGFL